MLINKEELFLGKWATNVARSSQDPGANIQRLQFLEASHHPKLKEMLKNVSRKSRRP